MRIIAGEFRRRVLLSPKDASVTRPIPDRVKESLFSLLRGNCEGANVLDVFAGTGSIGLEAVSRGASRCVFVERDRRIADLLERNIETLGCEDRCELVRSDALGPATLARAPRPLTLAFFDPPFPIVLDPEGWERIRRQFGRVIDLLSDDGFATLRTPWPLRHEELIHADGRREWRSVLVGMGERKERTTNARRHPPQASDLEIEDKSWEGAEVDLDAIAAEHEDDLMDRMARDEGGQVEGRPDIEVVRHMADMTFPNADGPETHIYGSQAVHLYMRKKSASPGE
jgi:16S rRNA (guanine(966)-N(2))-methyltransferase RsmD